MSEETTTAPAVAPSADVEAARKRKRLWIILIALFSLLLLLLAALFAWYLTTRKPLTQIPIISTVTTPGYAFSLYDVNQPLGVAVDDANNRVYVTQSSGTRLVAVFDTEGNAIGTLTPPGAKGVMHLPVYVAVDPITSNVYVTDRATGALYVYDAAGTYLDEVKPEGTENWMPLAVTVGPTGTLYVSDVSADPQKVWALNPDGTVLGTFGEADGLSFPNGVAILDDGSLAVADSNKGRVFVYAQDGTNLGVLARGNADASLGLPRGMAVDDLGRLYVVDTVNHVVRVYDPATPVPEYSFSFGEEGDIDGAFAFPNGIDVDSRSRIYVTDRQNNRVQVWSY